jgi:hypothetical protein
MKHGYVVFHPFAVPLHHYLISWVQQGAQMVQLPLWQSPRCEKNKYFKLKYVIFCHKEILNYLAKEEGN